MTSRRARYPGPDRFRRLPEAEGEVGDLPFAVGQELVQGRVEGADDDGQAVHRLEDAAEILELEGFEFVEGGVAGGLNLGQDQGAHRGDAVFAEEHVLGAAEADAAGAEGAGPGGIGRGVGVGTDAETALVVGPDEKGLDIADEVGLDEPSAADDDAAAGAVDGDLVAGVDGHLPSTEGAGGEVDLNRFCTGDRGLAHTPGDDGGVRGHAAAGGEDRGDGGHGREVLGGGLRPDQDDRFARFGAGLSGFGVEDDAACGGAWAGGEAGGEDIYRGFTRRGGHGAGVRVALGRPA